jgi:hypothetical protein
MPLLGFKVVSFLPPAYETNRLACRPLRTLAESSQNSQEKTWGSTSTPGLRPPPRKVSVPTGETAACAITRGMLAIRARKTPIAAVKKTGPSG